MRIILHPSLVELNLVKSKKFKEDEIEEIIDDIEDGAYDVIANDDDSEFQVTTESGYKFTVRMDV
jgi:hypothetical protein